MPKTIHDYTLSTNAPSTAEIAYWDVDNEWTRRISKLDFIGAILTGGGAIATGGFTGTLPADGTFALLEGAQTFSGAKTHSALLSATAGIRFNPAHSTLNVYLESTWSVVITGSGSNPTVAYTTQAGKYTRIGNCNLFNIALTINTISGGSGDARISLPDTVGTTGVAACNFQTIDVNNNTINAVFVPAATVAWGRIVLTQDNGGNVVLQVSDLSAGDTIQIQGMFFV